MKSNQGWKFSNWKKNRLFTLTGSWTGGKGLPGRILQPRSLQKCKRKQCQPLPWPPACKEAKCGWKPTEDMGTGKVRPEYQRACIPGRDCEATERTAFCTQQRLPECLCSWRRAPKGRAKELPLVQEQRLRRKSQRCQQETISLLCFRKSVCALIMHLHLRCVYFGVRVYRCLGVGVDRFFLCYLLIYSTFICWIKRKGSLGELPYSTWSSNRGTVRSLPKKDEGNWSSLIADFPIQKTHTHIHTYTYVHTCKPEGLGPEEYSLKPNYAHENWDYRKPGVIFVAQRVKDLMLSLWGNGLDPWPCSVG